MSRIADVLEPNNLRPLFDAYNMTRDLVLDLRDDLSFARATRSTSSSRAST